MATVPKVSRTRLKPGVKCHATKAIKAQTIYGSNHIRYAFPNEVRVKHAYGISIIRDASEKSLALQSVGWIRVQNLGSIRVGFRV